MKLPSLPSLPTPQPPPPLPPPKKTHPKPNHEKLKGWEAGHQKYWLHLNRMDQASFCQTISYVLLQKTLECVSKFQSNQISSLLC